MTAASFQETNTGSHYRVEVTDKEIVLKQSGFLREMERRIPLHAIDSVEVRTNPSPLGRMVGWALGAAAMVVGALAFILGGLLSGDGFLIMVLFAVSLALAAIIVFLLTLSTVLEVYSIGGRRFEAVHLARRKEHRAKELVEAITLALPGRG